MAKQKDLPTTAVVQIAAPDVKGKGPSVSAAEDALFGGADTGPESFTPTASVPAPTLAPVEPPKPKAGPPKRAKSGGLSSLAASLGKPAKLNTLEKSKLDWNKYEHIHIAYLKGGDRG